MDDLILRVALIVLGVFAGVVVLLVRRYRLRDRVSDRHESLRTLGGAMLCFTVALGVLGTGLGVDPVWRLPAVGVSLAWVAWGATRELLELRKRK